MNILAVDTSGPVAGIAILKDGCVTFEETVVNKLTHSANLMPMIDAALSRTGMTLKDMHRLAVVVGPGSFTGVRIGVSTVKGLSHGSGIPCVAVDALQAMAAVYRTLMVLCAPFKTHAPVRFMARLLPLVKCLHGS